MGIILRYVCWGTPLPLPPGTLVADRPTLLPPRLGSTKPPPSPHGGGGAPLQPLKWFNTLWGPIPPGSRLRDRALHSQLPKDTNQTTSTNKSRSHKTKQWTPLCATQSTNIAHRLCVCLSVCVCVRACVRVCSVYLLGKYL